MSDTLNQLGDRCRGFLNKHILRKKPKPQLKPTPPPVTASRPPNYPPPPPPIQTPPIQTPPVTTTVDTGSKPPNYPPPPPPIQTPPVTTTVDTGSKPPNYPPPPPPIQTPPIQPPPVTTTVDTGVPPPSDPPPVPTIVDTGPPVVSEDQKKYETERATMALDETAVMRIGDTPNDQKLLREAYSASAAITKGFVDKGEYAEAFQSLTQLKLDLKAALDARRKAMVAATKLKCDAINTKLTEVETNGDMVWENVGGDKWKAAVDDIVDVQLDQDFIDRYDAINEKVAKAIAADPIIQNGFAKWAEWTADPTTNKVAMEDVMNKVLELQSAVLGLVPPTPATTSFEPLKPRSCGSFDSDTGIIKLNSGARSFPDFKELLDTLTHENTHAYQTKLINGYRNGSLPETDPNYNAAVILAMNDGEGYITSTESKQYPGKKAYMKQVCEMHAWRAGTMAGQAAYKAMKKAAKQGNK